MSHLTGFCDSCGKQVVRPLRLVGGEWLCVSCEPDHKAASIDDPPQWDVPGWDWAEGDYSWLSSKSGIHKDGTSIFFIHGGRIRHQAHLPYGHHTVEAFAAMVQEKAEGLDDPRVVWLDDTGGGDAGLWVEGTRAPNAEDLGRLQHARDLQKRRDEMEARALRKRRPDLFGATS